MPENERIPQDDWVDQDILTRGEAAERLAGEIERVTAELAGPAAGDEMLARRLAALKEAYAQMAGGPATP
jgi:sigma54-dependent transcription regulator